MHYCEGIGRNVARSACSRRPADLTVWTTFGRVFLYAHAFDDRSTPVLHYFNKYLRYHGFAVRPTTPGHTLATLTDEKQGVVVGGVEFQFHRTLRVPDNAPLPSNLPPVCSISFGIRFSQGRR
jgi:hypothetical protein